MWRASAASRHLVWTGMFVAVLALPIARVLMPRLPVFVLAPQMIEAEQPAAPVIVPTEGDASAFILPSPMPPMPTVDSPNASLVKPVTPAPARRASLPCATSSYRCGWPEWACCCCAPRPAARVCVN
jgi:hypothetical protein